MSWYTEEEKRQSIRKAREALAAANATLQDAALFPRETTPLGFLCKTKDDALVEPHESSKVTKAVEQQTPPTREAECEMTDSLREVLVGIVVELRRERRAEIQKAVDPLEREGMARSSGTSEGDGEGDFWHQAARQPNRARSDGVGAPT
jgi:hypothetical protein